ncbi:MAG: hypothetical protein E7607_07620 [Ruminococcaceae bacterium]|nr:hypothetical protein [Oscillospiraceae bacterium]
MKKKLLSLLLVAILVVVAFAFAGCKEIDEINARIDENQVKAQTAADETARKAAADLEDAKAALETLIAEGDKADAAALADAIADFNTAVEAAKTAANGADDALKAELTAAIEAAMKAAKDANDALEAKLTAEIAKVATDLATAKLNLEKLITDGATADAAALKTAVDNLNAAIEAAKTAANGANDALQATLEDLITKTKNEVAKTASDNLTAAVNTLNEAIAKKVDATTYTAKVDELAAAITAAETTAKTYADTKDAALKTELTNAIATAKDEAIKAATKLVDDKAAELTALIDTKVDATTYTAKVNELAAAITAAENTAKAYADTKDAALKTELTTAIATAKDEAIKASKEYVDGEIEKLQNAVDADFATYKSEMDKLEAAIVAIEEYTGFVGDNSAVKNMITDAKTAAIEAAKTYTDNQVEALKKTVDDEKATKTDVAVAIEEVNKAIDVAEKTAADADAALKTELEAAIAAANKATTDAWANWNAATDTVIENLYNLKIAYNEFTGEAYYATLPVNVQNKVLKIYTETETKLLRAVDIASANAAWDYAKATFETIDGIFEVYGAYDMDYYYAAEQTAMAGYFDAALQAIIDMTYESDVAAIKTTLAEQLDAVLTKAEVINNLLISKGDDIIMDVIYNAEWEALLNDVKALLDAESDELKAVWKDVVDEVDLGDVIIKYNAYKARYDFLGTMKSKATSINFKVFLLATNLNNTPVSVLDMGRYGYNANNAAEFADLLAEIEAWDAELVADGDTNDTNKAMIDRAAVEAMETSYADLKAEHEAYIADLVARLEGFGAEYVYNYNVDYDKINALYAEANKFALVQATKGFAAPAEFVAAFDTFEAGAYARANALAVAKAEADEINGRIDQLIAELTYITTFKSEYQTRMNEIKADVDTWVATYFTGDYAAEAVAGNTNYELIDHAGYEELEALYVEKIVPVYDAMDAVVEKFNADGFVTINVLSGDDITAARNAWQAFVNKVNDLGLDIEDIGTIKGITGKATPAKIAQLLDNKTIEYRAACAQAVADYEALNILNKNNVTIYDKADVDAMVAWYNTYLGIDATDAASAVPADGIDLALSDDLVITVELYDAAKATYTAWKTLTDAKLSEEKALEDDIAAFVELIMNTEKRVDADKLLARYEAFMNGANVPAGYSVDQYKITAAAPYAIDNYDALLVANDKIIFLEGKRDELFDRVDALTKTIDDLLTATAADEYKALIATLESDIAVFTHKNLGFNCFVESDGTAYINREIKITTAKFTTAQAYAVMELTAKVNAAKVAINANGGSGLRQTSNEFYSSAYANIYNAVAYNNDGVLVNGRALIEALEVEELNASYTTDKLVAILEFSAAKADALVDVAEAYKTYIKIADATADNANSKVWASADAVTAQAIVDIKAVVLGDTAVADLAARADEAVADLGVIREMADVYDDAILNVEFIGTDAVKADLTARAEAALDAAIATIVEIGNEGIATDESYELDNARLALVKYTITEYVRIRDLDAADAKTEAAMAERYENTVKGTSIAQMSDEKVAEYKAAGKTIADLLNDANASVTNFFNEVGIEI